MPRKKREPEQLADPGLIAEQPEQPADGIAAGPEPSAVDTKPARKVIGLPTRDDGSIDVGSMRDSTLQKVREAIQKTPELSAVSGSRERASGLQLPVFAIDGIWDLIGTLEAAAAATRLPREVAGRIFMYSPDEKEALREPTRLALAELPIPDIVSRYPGCVTLGMTLVNLHFSKLQMMRNWLATQQQDGSQKTAA